MVATILTPRQIVIGGGALKQSAQVLQALGLSRPLVVSDPLMVKLGKVEALTAVLEAGGLSHGLFADTVPDPTDSVIEAGVAALQAGDYDCMVALGGGSPMDTAKAMSVLHRGGGKMRDYKVPHQCNDLGLPVICVPTTAGTGSEVTRFTVITDTETDEKMLITGLGCLPAAAIVDYELTFTVPFRTTADTGIDSLTHAIEAYVSRKANLYSDAFARAAMRRIYANIKAACREPDNAAAREQMMLGALEGGMAFSNASVALVHGMSRPIGAFFHVPHGLSNAMLLPAVTAFSAPEALSRYADCARFMGLVDESVGDQLAVNRLLEALRELNAELEVPTPAAYGIEAARYEEVLPTMAKQALASGSPGNNPRVPSEEEIMAIYREVYG